MTLNPQLSVVGTEDPAYGMNFFGFSENVCSCQECQAMCQRKPCWPTPREAARLIRFDFGPQLMLEHWVEDDYLPATEILSPAVEGYEARRASEWGDGCCTFFNCGKCLIHHRKPLEGRLARHDRRGRDGFRLHLEVARTWATPSGRSLIRLWKARFLS